MTDAYRVRQAGEPGDNIEAAIKAYEAAVTVARAALDAKWRSAIEGRLGAAYAERINGSRSDNNELSIKAYEAALPAQIEKDAWWAELQRRLGIAYEMRAKGERSGNLLRAARAYEAALTVFTAPAFPAKRAEVEQLKNRTLCELSSPAPQPEENKQRSSHSCRYLEPSLCICAGGKFSHGHLSPASPIGHAGY
ncbi:MAG: hypothetical protein ACLPPF_19495 [Rhodomicrobium sp.]